MQRAKLGSKWFGKTKAQADIDTFAAHDGSETWDDAGAAQQIADQAVREIRTTIANQVRDGVAEYATNAQFAMRAEGGELIVGLNMSNHVAPLIVEISLTELINAALDEAYKAVATPDGQDILTALTVLNRGLSKITAALPQAPARPTTVAQPQQAQPKMRRPAVSNGSTVHG
jgi:hypothetical protein